MPRARPEPVQTKEYPEFVSPTREPEPMTEVDIAAEAQRIFEDDLVDPDDVDADVRAMEINALERELDQPKGLHAKLADLRANFGFIGKTGTNTGVGGGYKFVEATEVGRRFVQMASERGLTMLPINMEITDIRPSVSGKQFVYTVTSTWKITDAVTGEFELVPSFGQGADNGDKALPKAQTNCMKYAILLLLQAAGDDPENDPRTDQIENTPEGQGITITGSNVPGVRQGGRQTKTTSAQMDAIRSEARRLDLDPESFAVLIASILGGKAPEIDDKETIIEQQGRILAFCGELEFAEAGELIRGLRDTEDYEDLTPPEDIGAK